ncbi:chemokine XC receptor 1-like [Danio rerio]|uniref:Chemokine XC receptor 1-like n=2 Tax=Danio rerio TaxID=7955 RepID=A0A8M1PYR9_DANRE|nr:chemokine XC receptor 1-like [Danio rerio]|eukprot:XP_001333240.4 chemokine XC receptor 1-like [Danio rerio]
MTDENTTYDYDDYYEDQLCRKDDVVKFGSIIIPLFFSIVVVMSCIGNILVLIILALYENLKSLTNVFIIHLSVSNLLFTFGLPFWASYFIHGWTFGEIGCKAVKFLFYVGFYSSVMFLTLMTIQRYMAVVHPLSDWEKCRCFSVAPIIIWMMSGTAALVGAHYSKILKDLNNTYCEYESIKVKSGIAYYQNAFFFIAFIFVWFCYGRMCWAITKYHNRETHRTVRLTFLIALLLFFGWTPYNIAMFLRSLTDQNIYPFTLCEVSKTVDYAYYICRLIAFSHCSVNPALFIFADANFCKHLRKRSWKFFSNIDVYE